MIASGQAISEEERDFALLIAIKEYSELDDLDSSQEDVKRIREWLEHQKGGHLTDNNIYEPLADSQEHASSKIKEAFQEICVRAKNLPDGARRLYLYCTGHGKSAGNRNAHLCLPDWSTDGNINSVITAASYTDASIDSDLFEEVYVFFDCCRSKTNGSDDIESSPRPFTNTNLDGAKHNRGRVIGFATRDGYTIPYYHPEVGDRAKSCSYFTMVLAQGLMGGAAESNGGVKVSSLLSYIRDYTPLNSKINGDGEQEPHIWADQIENVILGATTPTRKLIVTLNETFDNPLFLLGPKGTILQEVDEPNNGRKIEWEIPELGHYIIKESKTNRELWHEFVFGAEEPLNVKVSAD